jgi:hypothetical protein
VAGGDELPSAVPVSSFKRLARHQGEQ